MGFAEYADFGAPLWTYRTRIWGGAMDLLVARVPSVPDTHKSLEPSSWSVDQGRAWESAGVRMQRQAGWKDPEGQVRLGRAAAWKWAREDQGTTYSSAQTASGLCPRNSSLVCLLHLLWPVGQFHKVLTPLQRRHYQARVRLRT